MPEYINFIADPKRCIALHSLMLQGTDAQQGLSKTAGCTWPNLEGQVAQNLFYVDQAKGRGEDSSLTTNHMVYQTDP